MVPANIGQMVSLILAALFMTSACSDYQHQRSADLKGAPESGTSLGVPSVLHQMPDHGDLEKYKVAAYAGSGSAANSLALFYSKADPTGGGEFYWTMVGAENGDRVAQFNLATLYLEKSEGRHSLQRAIFWLKKSAASGDENAKKLLFRMKQA